MKTVLISILLACAPQAVSQRPDMEHTPFKIGVVNYFGYGGLDLQAVRTQLPLHVGDVITFAAFTKAPTEAVVNRLTGHPPTDVNITCCDDKKELLIYIGLAGTSSRPMPASPSPRESVQLDQRPIALYDKDVSALKRAVTSGDAGEDDSEGYALSKDPALHEVNISMRSYAAGREREFIRVLRTASDPRQRRVAAMLLGYVRRTPRQVNALDTAVSDPDDEVRNNAVRALFVLSAARNAKPLHVDPEPFIRLLFSGKWTDRNKVSLLLDRLTDGHNLELLASLRKRALPPLIEGASWAEDPGHSIPFLVILGRIGGIPDDRLQHLIATQDSSSMIAAALR